MSTGVQRTSARRAVLPGLLVTALAAVALVAFLAPLRGSGSSRDAPAASGAPAVAHYPREVRVADLADSTLRETALRSTPPITVLVEVAPAVYAQRRPGPLGTVDDYTSVFGRCADVNHFAQSHHVARACY